METQLYAKDFYGWAYQQAQLLREQNFDQVDWSNVIEEIEDSGRSECRALVLAIEELILHLLKWQYQKELRSPSWRHSIDKQRLKIEHILEDNPSLQRQLGEIVRKAYKYGRKGTSKETFLDLDIFPAEFPYTWKNLVDEFFYPD